MNSDHASPKLLEEMEAIHPSFFEIGGVTLELVDARHDAARVTPSLQAFCSSQRKPTDISIRVQWVSNLPRDSARQVFDSGCTWQLYEQGSEFRFDFQVPALGPAPYKRLFIDRHFTKAILQINQQTANQDDRRLTPLMYPLDELLIMHRLTQEKAIELHGCGIVRPDGTGNLFVGHSGAGKSTTTRLWTEREDVLVLSDDRIIVRRDEGASVASVDCSSQPKIPRPRNCPASPPGHSARDDNAVMRQEKLIPYSAHADNQRMRMYGTPWHGEAMYASPESSTLTRIFILEHGWGNVLTPLSPSQAVAELFARSFVPFHQHEYVESALAFLQELVNSVPVYRYAFEPDQRSVDTILNFHD